MLYYKPIINEQQLLEDGYSVCENTVHKYRKELGLKAVLAVKTPGTTIVNKEHPMIIFVLNDS